MKGMPGKKEEEKERAQKAAPSRAEDHSQLVLELTLPAGVSEGATACEEGKGRIPRTFCGVK